jgi:hypothetical protein
METLTQHELPAVRAASTPPSLQMEFLSDERGLYVRLPLTRGMFALVDFEDLGLVNAAAPWSAMWNGSRWYVKNGEWIYLHRYVLNAPRGLVVDHRDSDGLNNRRWNLRVATHAQNSANCIKPRLAGGTSSRFKGIDFCHGRWVARIRAGGRRHFLGSFESEETAARAYDNAALEHHGEFARLNFPEGRT